MNARNAALGLATLSLAGLAGLASGAVNFNGSYAQNFDGLGATGAATLTGRGPHALNGVIASTNMDGWEGANFLGTSTNTEVRAQDGSLSGSAGRGVISFGTGGSSDRALGTLATSNQISSFGVVFTNTSTDTYESLRVTYTGEQWRAGEAGLLNTLAFAYGFGGDLNAATTGFSALTFTTPNLTGGEIGINGNLASNQGVVDATITGLNWAPGTSLVLRWNGGDLTGQDNGLAIDNLNITGIVPAPGSLALLAIGGLVGGRRRR